MESVSDPRKKIIGREDLVWNSQWRQSFSITMVTGVTAPFPVCSNDITLPGLFSTLPLPPPTALSLPAESTPYNPLRRAKCDYSDTLRHVSELPGLQTTVQGMVRWLLMGQTRVETSTDTNRVPLPLGFRKRWSGNRAQFGTVFMYPSKHYASKQWPIQFIHPHIQNSKLCHLYQLDGTSFNYNWRHRIDWQ